MGGGAGHRDRRPAPARRSCPGTSPPPGRRCARPRQVVGDEQIRQPEFVLQVFEQVEDLGLDAHVQGADRLVAHDELGSHRERPSDADALPLAAAELVRIAFRSSGRSPTSSSSSRTRSATRCPGQAVDHQRLGQMSPTVMRGSRTRTGPGRSSGSLRRAQRTTRHWRQDDHAAVSMEPGRGRWARTIDRPVVVLPEPDSPTRPSVSPSRI